MKNKAFTLIEIAVVISLVGVFVLAITAGSKLIETTKTKQLSSVSSSSSVSLSQITQNSPVGDIADLSYWFESSLADSFTGGIIPNDGDVVTTIKNLTGNDYDIESSTFVNPTSVNYYTNIFNNVNGIGKENDATFTMGMDLKLTVGKPIMFFLVEKPHTSIGSSLNYLFQSQFPFCDDYGQPLNFLFQYLSDGRAQFQMGGCGWALKQATSSSLPSDSSKIRIWTVRTNPQIILKLDGEQVAGPSANSWTPTRRVGYVDPNDTPGYIRIGSGGNFFEFILFTRDITEEEELSVQSYLLQKYSTETDPNDFSQYL
jgi:prepilin-type N-terminal cleavage/methylation domain-containing protein